MLTQGLIIDEPWIGHILAGRKTWEMRSRGTTKRGPIALIRKGSGMVVATATLAECRQALSAAAMPAHFDKHQIPQPRVQSPDYKWFTPWVLTDIMPLARPIPYKHPTGAVTFVNLEPIVIEAIRGQDAAGFPIDQAALPERSPDRAHTNRNDRSEAKMPLARQVLAELSLGPTKVEVPTDAAVSVSRRGNKLYIDAVWDDGLPGIGARSDWRELIGTLSAAGAWLCMVAITIMIMIGVATWSMKFFYAFYVVPPMFVLMLITTFTGQGHLLPDLGEGHDRGRKSR